MIRKFLITGLRPAYGECGERLNKLLRAMDLGIEGVEGAYMPFADLAEATISEEATPEQLAKQPAAIKGAYEATGHKDVIVAEMT